jgi:plasmid maintenance system killer protein
MMEIAFGSRKMPKLCNSEKEMRSKLGDRGAKALQLRLTQIKAADTLEDLGKVPGARCHELTADRKGQLAVDLVHPRRLIFKPDHNPTPAKPDGGLDRQQVTRVVVIEIFDYHP